MTTLGISGGTKETKQRPLVWILLLSTIVAFAVLTPVYSQLQQSGGPGSTVTIGAGSAVIGHVIVDTAPSTAVTNANLDVALSTRLKPADTLTGVTTVGAVTAITNALPGGTNLLGFVKTRPTGCTAALTSDVIHDTVGVATGAGTTVSSVTGCIEECYVNNITNSAVTLRIADKAGTPVIWVGGNADFSIPANSNLNCGANGGLSIAGISFTSGITAIAGTGSALNLHIVTRE